MTTQGGKLFVDTHYPSWLTMKMQAAFARAFRRFEGLAVKAATAGQMADFVVWQERVFGAPLELCARREVLWEQCRQQLDPGRRVVVLEFGVAHGYATDWWLQRLGSDVVWHGFDRFTGLPRAWAGLEKGAFDNQGVPPAIDDPRVQWHVGDVEDTLKEVPLERGGEQWLVLFDLDIFEPTAFAWDVIAGYLRPGDVLYFDEAFDHDERRVLEEMVLPTVDVEPVAVTAAGIGLVVT